MKKSLIVMAAGMGSRFGGLKQVARFGASNKAILDFAVEDARAAGIEKVAFVIRKDIEGEFRRAVSEKYESLMDVRYVFQDLSGAKLPQGRSKPWGTGHAVLACIDEIGEPFIAANADDYYGAGVYVQASDFLDGARPASHALAGYRLKNTLSPNGGVSRGVCFAEADLSLAGMREFSDIRRDASGEKISCAQGRDFSGDEYVSLNFWSFVPDFMQVLGEYFEDFLSKNFKSEKAEFYLPDAVDRAVKERRTSVKILPTDERWQGVTYREDMPLVEEFLKAEGRI